MKFLITLLFICSTNIVLAQNLSPEQRFQDRLLRQKEAIGKPFPSFKAKLGDSIVNNNSLAGKTVFVNFWFEACPPCIAEFQGLNQLYDSLKTDTTVAFISFTYETKRTIAKIKEKYGLRFPIVSVSADDCYQLNQQNGFPTNMILGTDLAIRHIESGGRIDPEQARWHIMHRIYPVLKRIQATGL